MGVCVRLILDRTSRVCPLLLADLRAYSNRLELPVFLVALLRAARYLLFPSFSAGSLGLGMP